ncbi:hypothetical protein H634G_10067 [Metarhizium anisopliae BRIP 53293]|uniref:Uncharacterized protein n=1 Tax=Metarhizium anisopliae BRIP 53293 TaxID=1291518 RepID=A0A0D9NQ56_METAN|nr:hypothetical protein H634G_10067 [Metarhizium anisopliae BRIP 53293]
MEIYNIQNRFPSFRALTATDNAAFDVFFASTTQSTARQRWLLGGGLGVGMLCLWIYAQLYRTDGEDRLILPKQLRVGMRLVVAVILAVLPETHDHLTTTEFMAVVMSLFAFLILWETIGGLMKGARFFEPWTDRHAPAEGDSSEALT